MKQARTFATILLLMAGALSAFAQQRTITGKVSDTSELPVLGAAVLVDGTSQGVTTDMDGLYSISVKTGDVVLVFQSLGYETKRVTVPMGTDVVNVVLKEDAMTLDETVVVGYGTQKKVNLTGAITAVDAKSIENRTSHNISTMLQGTVPGLNVSTTSGNPGSTATLNVRGYTSIHGGSPLVLIDGVEGDIDRINPNDVASISIIKDASSAAVYGARAAFGVILVTTKEGKSDNEKAVVRYSGRWGIETPTTSTDWETRGYWSVYTINKFWYETKGSNYVNYNNDDMIELLARVNDKKEHPDRPWVVTTADGKHYKYYANTDWWHEMYNDYHPVNNHSISISGGNKAVKYYISGQYDRQQGMIKANPDVFEKYNIRAKIDARINKYARISNNTNFFTSSYNYPGLNNVQDSFAYSNRHAPACFPLKNPDGSWLYFVDAIGYRVANGRHYAYAEGFSNLQKRNDLANTTELTITPTRQFTIKANYTYRTYQNHNTHRGSKISYSQTPGEIAEYDNGGAFTNWMGEAISEYVYTSSNVFATYENTFKEAHHLTAMIGTNFDTFHRKSVGARGYDLITKELSDLSLISTSKRAPEISGGQTAWRNLGFFGRLNYDYKGRYLAEVSARYDGSSRFAVGHKWGFFPSASLGWRISEEPFFAPIKSMVNNLKFRASYGTLGNQKTSSNYTFMRLVNFRTFSGYNFGGSDMARYTNLDDPVSSDLTWETTQQSNIGIDLGMFNNRLDFTAEAYIRNTIGMLTEGMDLPAVYGASEPEMNAADLSTKGFELSLSWRDSFRLFGKEFNYGFKPTLSYYTTHITKFANKDKLLSNFYEGMEVGEIWGFKTDGLFKSTEEAIAYTTAHDQSYFNANLNGGWKAGDLKFVDQNNDGVINIGKNTVEDHGDLVYLGNALPKLHYGLTTSFQYLGFDFSIFFEGTGNHYWYPSRSSFDFWGPYSLGYPTFISKGFLDKCWSEDNPDAYFPRPRSNVASNSGGELGRLANDRYIQNVRYTRLKNLTFGYELPKKLISHVGLEKFRIYFSGENLYYWSPITKVTDHIDPESCFNRNNSTGDDLNNGSYPWQKTYMFGIDITF